MFVGKAITSRHMNSFIVASVQMEEACEDHYMAIVRVCGPVPNLFVEFRLDEQIPESGMVETIMAPVGYFPIKN